MYLHRLFWFFFLALKRKIRQWWPVELLARPESGCCCVGAAVVLGCVAVTQIIRKLEEPVSVRCGMQPKYRIAVRKKQRDLLQISLGQIIDPGPVLRLYSIPWQWYTFITRCEIHGYNKCLHCFFCFFGFFWPYLISKCRIQVQIQIYRYICAPFGQTLTCWLSETEREREGERAGRVAVCGWAGVFVWGARLTVRLQTTRRRRDPEIPALIRSNATIARGCLAKNSIRYKPGTKDIKPSSQYSSSQNVQKQLSRSRSPPHKSLFIFAERTIRIRLRFQQVRVKCKCLGQF